MGSDPLEGGVGVGVGGGKRVLRRESVVDGDEDDVGFGDKYVERVVVEGIGNRGYAKCAAVEVDHQGEFLVSRCEFGAVEPGGDTGLRYDHGVFGDNTSFQVEGCWDNVSSGESFDGSIFVDPEVR